LVDYGRSLLSLKTGYAGCLAGQDSDLTATVRFTALYRYFHREDRTELQRLPSNWSLHPQSLRGLPSCCQNPSAESSALVSIAPSPAYSERKFWDKKNRALFAAVTALNVADFAVTHANLQNGENETIARVLGGRRRGWWRTPRAKMRAGVTGLSYLFRKTGHRNVSESSPWSTSAPRALP